jgi:apolipoprotein N-acyltransferase
LDRPGLRLDCPNLHAAVPAHAEAQNKAIVVAPAATGTLEYLKSHPVPGDPETGGPRRIQYQDTPMGRIATAICFDLDFPGFLRQAGGARADLLLVPAKDWREIADLHAQMATCRAIENGTSLVRATGDGVSIVTDPLGRTLGSSNTFAGASPGFPGIMTEVPTRSVPTLYARIGDLFAWLCLAGFTAISALALRRPRSTRPSEGSVGFPVTEESS